MKTHKNLLTLVCLIALSATVLAQTTANWSSGAGDNDWNNPLNWDTLDVPGIGTNAVIGGGMTPNYNAPMAAANFAGVNNSGILTVSAAGFNIDALGTLPAYTGNGGSLLQVNSGGVVVATNSTAITLTTGSAIAVEGGVLVITNSTGNISFGVNANNAGAGFTNNGGTAVFSQPFQSRGRYSRFEMHGGSLAFLGGGGILEGSNDQERRFLIDGGTANLGDFSIARTLNTVGAAGLVISNSATVNVTSLRIGTGIAASGATIYGGVLTNTGTFTIADRNNAATSGQRRVFLYVRGGTVVSTAAEGIVVANQANNSSTGGSSVWGGFLDINAGTVVAEKLTLVGPNALTNAHATLTLAGSGALYLGSGGLVGNVGYSNTSYTMTLSGGTLGATADYSIVGNGTLSGTLTVNAADLGGNPHNITHTGGWGGSGALVKTGGGTLALNAANTYSGATTVSAGTLAIGGSIANTPSITVAAGATLDVSAVAPYTLASGRILQGEGTVVGSVIASSGASIRPAGAGAAGILTISGGLTQNGGVINSIEFSALTNDVIEVIGDLDLNPAGTNLIAVTSTGGAIAAGTYTLIHYSGTLLNGDATKFQLSGIPGTITHDAGAKTISLTTSGLRGPTSVFWKGGTPNDWDVINSLNWNDGVSDSYFVNGDIVRFDAAGAANPSVNLAEVVQPGSVTVDATTGYTFSGAGNIGGAGGLTKTNSGSLTINATNSYTGATTLGGGVIEIPSLAGAGFSSPIGAASASPANLVFAGGTLRYTGASLTTDRGATLSDAGGTIEVTDSAAALTMSGTLTGNGSFTKAGPGTLTLTAANDYTNGTVINGGVLRVNTATSAGSGAITNNGGTFRIATSTTIANAMEFSGTCTVDLNNNGGNQALDGAWSGDGTVNIINQQNATNRTFTMGGNGSGGGHMDNFTGVINLGTNSWFFRFNDGGGSYNFGNSNLFLDLGTGTATFLARNRGVTIQLGALAGGSGTMLTYGTDGSGTTTYVIGGRNVDSTMSGTINSASGAPIALTKVGLGTLTLAGSSLHHGPTLISSGTLALSGSGTINNSPTLDLAAGAVLDSSARTDGALVLTSGQTLLGEGTVRGSVTVQSNATVSPGPTAGGIGKMTVTNALTLQPGGILLMEADHFSATNDVIEGLASVTYGGTLNLSLLSVDLTSSFKLFSAAAYGGAFDTITPASPGPGWVWDVGNLTVDGTLKVKTFVFTQPNITTSSLVGTNLVLSGAGGPPYTGYTVLSSSDLTLPVAFWSPAGTGNFKGDGSFVFTTPVDTNGPQLFYAVQYTTP